MIDANPFFVNGPAVINFSGGRTSAYMLRRILDAHVGVLPDNVVVSFQNTGREMPATLDFVRDCGAAWNVPIVWLEYRWKPGAHSYEVVNHNSSSRNGEPFEMMLAGKKMLPNPVARFCTSELKINTLKRWIVSEMRWKHWLSYIGMRADEPKRVERAIGPQRDRWVNRTPLATVGVTKIDVLRFWRDQPFDLRIAGPWEGNCDGCFLKSRASIARMMADHPERMRWWAAMENRLESKQRPGAKNVFRADRENYEAMASVVRDQGVLPMTWLEAEMPCTSGGCGI